MPTGGARPNAGRPQEPNALRHDRSNVPSEKDGWITLPAEGRDGDTPHWPLADQTTREAAVWANLWQSPQAVAWEANHSEWEVAFFVRRLVQAEKVASSSNNATLVRQQMDSLGLTAPGMRANRWKLSDAQVGPRLVREPLPDNKYSARNRIKRVV